MNRHDLILVAALAVGGLVVYKLSSKDDAHPTALPVAAAATVPPPPDPVQGVASVIDAGQQLFGGIQSLGHQWKLW